MQILTIDFLLDNDASVADFNWFKQEFPNGASVTEILSHDRVPLDLMHWMHDIVGYTADEMALYHKRTGIECEKPLTIYKSDNITDSEFVWYSSSVTDSRYVHTSNDIINGEIIYGSEYVENAKQVFDSSFVYYSTQVLLGSNVNDSNNVVNSGYVINSHSVMNADNVRDSAFVTSFERGRTSNIHGSYFITDCTNMTNCLFCADKTEGEYLVFNKQVAAADYILITNQLLRILKNFRPALTEDGYWPGVAIPVEEARPQRSLAKMYDHLPEAFWKWVRTIPGYDPIILYKITFSRVLL